MSDPGRAPTPVLAESVPVERAGYSGLGQLAALRPDYIKLDRELVREADIHPPRAALVASLADYACHTSSLLVAEGVETPAELETVRDAGAHLVQASCSRDPGRRGRRST